MFQAPLPQEFATLSPEDAKNRIIAAKKALGSRVVILGHHYQRDEVIQHADYRGDSFKLAKDANKHPEAEFIIFCGVHFMAESADILTPDHQKVILPNLAAGCSMADMANLFQVRNCWQQLEAVGRKLQTEERRYATSTISGRKSPFASPSATGDLPSSIIPITYINSAANLKAFVGEHGGTVCTSSNAPKAVEWALSRADKVLFFPDQHLGRNTGVKLGYHPDKEMAVWDPHKALGGNSEEQLQAAKFILWKGHCSVHQRFTTEQVQKARAQFPDINVIVHPECPLEVVRLSDYSGSTEFIIRTIESASEGTIWAVGTEVNLVSRLAKENPDKTIFCLDPMICPCSTMYRIHPSFLCWALENLVAGTPVNVIEVPSDIKENAKLALDRMLTIV